MLCSWMDAHTSGVGWGKLGWGQWNQSSQLSDSSIFCPVLAALGKVKMMLQQCYLCRHNCLPNHCQLTLEANPSQPGPTTSLWASSSSWTICLVRAGGGSALLSWASVPPIFRLVKTVPSQFGESLPNFDHYLLLAFLILSCFPETWSLPDPKSTLHLFLPLLDWQNLSV